ALFFVHSTHRIIFILELDLLDALFLLLHGSVGVEGDEFTGLIPGVVVLMPRARRRRDAGSFVPVVALRFFPFVPHQSIAGGVEQEDMSAGTVAVRFFVAANRKRRAGGEHGAAEYVNIFFALSFPPLLPRQEVDLANMGNKF